MITAGDICLRLYPATLNRTLKLSCKPEETCMLRRRLKSLSSAGVQLRARKVSTYGPAWGRSDCRGIFQQDMILTHLIVNRTKLFSFHSLKERIHYHLVWIRAVVENSFMVDTNLNPIQARSAVVVFYFVIFVRIPVIHHNGTGTIVKIDNARLCCN